MAVKKIYLCIFHFRIHQDSLFGDEKNKNIFWGGGKAPTPDPSPTWGGGYPLPKPHPLGAFGTSINAPSALTSTKTA